MNQLTARAGRGYDAADAARLRQPSSANTAILLRLSFRVNEPLVTRCVAGCEVRCAHIASKPRFSGFSSVGEIRRLPLRVRTSPDTYVAVCNRSGSLRRFGGA